MKLILKFIKNCDLYGKGITLNINGKETINSLFGGTFSLLYLIFFLSIFIKNFQTFLRKDPVVTLSSAFRDITEAYDNITQPELYFSFFIMDFKRMPPKPLAVYPYNITKLADKLVYVNNTETHDRSLKLGDMVKCEDSQLYMEDKLFKSPYNIAKTKASGKNFSMCFEVNKENGFFTLGGDTETRNTSFLNNFNVYYDLCHFLDKPRGCNLTDVEYNQLSALSVILLIKNSHAEYNMESGIVQFWESKRIKVDLSLDYSIQFHSRRLKISTDRNIIYNIFESEENQNYFHTLIDSTQHKTSNKNELKVSFGFSLSNYIDSVDRSYMKVDEMLANVGSIIVIVEILANSLAGFFSEGNMEHSIYKELFHIQKKENRKAGEFLNVDFTKFVIKKKNYNFKGLIGKIINEKNQNENAKAGLHNKDNKNENLFANVLKERNFEIKNLRDNHKDNNTNTNSEVFNFSNNVKAIEDSNNNSDLNSKINFNKDSDRSTIGFQEKLQEDIELKNLKNVNEVKELEGCTPNDINNIKGGGKNEFKNKTYNEESENLSDYLAKSKMHINLPFNNNDNNKIISNEKKSDKKVYDDFRKILKEKTIKKSYAVRFHQIFSCLLKHNKNVRLLINMQDFISEELDMVKILKKLIEYENFKTLILTENQRKIFNIMQKRIITEEILEEDASDFYKDFYFKNKMKDLKNFKHLVDHLFDFDEENKYSQIIIQKLKDSFSL